MESLIKALDGIDAVMAERLNQIDKAKGQFPNLDQTCFSIVLTFFSFGILMFSFPLLQKGKFQIIRLPSIYLSRT